MATKAPFGRSLKAAQVRRAAFGNDGEDQMITKVVNYLTLQGYTVWRQENSGRFSVVSAVEAISRYIKNLLAATSSGQQLDLFDRRTKEDTGRIERDIRSILNTCWRKVPNSVKGVADIIGWGPDGKWIAVEIKVASDVLSLEQRAWLTSLHKSGGQVWVCPHFDSFRIQFEARKAQST